MTKSSNISHTHMHKEYIRDFGSEIDSTLSFTNNYQGPPKYAFFRASIMLFSPSNYAFYAFESTELCFFCFHDLWALLIKIFEFFEKIELNSLILTEYRSESRD